MDQNGWLSVDFEGGLHGLKGVLLDMSGALAGMLALGS